MFRGDPGDGGPEPDSLNHSGDDQPHPNGVTRHGPLRRRLHMRSWRVSSNGDDRRQRAAARVGAARLVPPPGRNNHNLAETSAHFRGLHGTTLRDVHELSLCHAIAGVVKSHAAGRPVEAVRVRVGALRQVVPDSLAFCWTVVAEHDGLAGAALEIEQVPAEVDCRACGRQSEIASRWSVCCPACGAADVAVVRGEEFLVTSIDVATETARGPPWVGFTGTTTGPGTATSTTSRTATATTVAITPRRSASTSWKPSSRRTTCAPPPTGTRSRPTASGR